MKRKFISILTLLCMIIALLPSNITVYAAISGTCGKNLTWTLDDEGTLTISGAGDMTDWTHYLNVPWYTSVEEIKKVIIPNGVTSIGNYAFLDCTNLTNVTIPKSVTSIGNGVFAYCYSLTSINVDGNNANYCSVDGNLFNKSKTELIQYAPGKNDTQYEVPAGVTSIGEYAFENVYNLTSITLPDSVISIEDSAFAYCTDLISITIGSGLKNVGDCAFEGCSSLTNVYYNGSKADWNKIEIGSYNYSLTNAKITYAVTSVTCGDNLTWTLDDEGTLTISGTGDMWNWDYYSEAPWDSSAYYIKSVVISNGVTSIGDMAFYFCTNLTDITIPNSVTSIGDRAFSYCYSLTSINVDENNANYCSVDGNLFNKSKTELIQYAIGKSDTQYKIPDGVTSIGDGVFSNCNSLTSVTIPNGVTSIGDWAFSSCYNLTSVTIPDSVTSIGDMAFDNCYSLTSITIPNGVTSIGNSAFNNCDRLTSVTIPNGVTSIGDKAFSLCEGLTSITIPNSVTSIYYGAFSDCTGLTNVYYTGSETDWNNIWIDRGNYSLTNAKITYAVTSGTCGANLAWLIDYEGTLTISGTGDMTDWSSSSNVPWYSSSDDIKSVIMFDGITSIGDYAFDCCDSLNDVYYYGSESNWNNIKIGSNNDSLANAKITHGDKIIVASGKGEDNLTWTRNAVGTLTISGTGDMNDYPWYSSRKTITSIIISDGVTSIGNSAFEDCTNLTSVTIPNSVTSIGNSAFSSCYNLTSVTIGNGVTSIGDYAFYHCDSLTSVTVPNSVTSIGDWAFSSCYNLTSVTIGNGVTSIGDYAFYYCDSLTNVTIGNSVKSIGDGAFYRCDSLTDVYYIGSESDWNNIQIGYGNNYLTNAKKTYITETEKSTKTTVSADGKSFVVKAENISNGNVIVIALYDGDKIIDTQSVVYSGSDATFNTSKDYTAAKVMVWESMSNIAPVCEAEVIAGIKKHTQTTLSADGKSFAVKAENIASGNVIVIALYNGDKLIDTQSAIYGGSDVTFNTNKAYTAAKVMVWESMSNIAPVCEAEIVK